jgi:hypothetical protein
MRLKAMQAAGWKDVPVEVVDWPEEKQREFIIKDNVGFGEWDWDMLANEWDAEQLTGWGLEVEFSAHSNFDPIITPETNYNDVTKEQIQKEAERLASQMIKEKRKIDCICPECGTEFEIDG